MSYLWYARNGDACEPLDREEVFDQTVEGVSPFEIDGVAGGRDLLVAAVRHGAHQSSNRLWRDNDVLGPGDAEHRDRQTAQVFRTTGTGCRQPDCNRPLVKPEAEFVERAVQPVQRGLLAEHALTTGGMDAPLE